MEINFYRHDNPQGYDQSWQACHFTSNTDNLPHEACKDAAQSNEEAIVEAPSIQPGPLCRDSVAAPRAPQNASSDSSRPAFPSDRPCPQQPLN